MKLLYWCVVAIVAAALALFAVSNRAAVALGLWPLPFLVEAPLYLVVFAGIVLGFLLGAASVWVSGRQARRERRRGRRRLAALERELSATQSRLASAASLPSPAATRAP